MAIKTIASVAIPAQIDPGTPMVSAKNGRNRRMSRSRAATSPRFLKVR
ncbi:MAG: hypothetical protein ACOX80_06865 [Methanomassiliicoccaceae archaeon]|nr:hypothetical protein [Methanomassiliicoccaceae archaeon]HOL07058.1 hypothetical protein [Methanomassiliicoccaceae archaeon]HQA21608.1 hypothetical protein [Methanomassiliicoccaceae archaeon]HQD87795.1 hypothetical protein [Methanomassiliicoccaceae archaeon]